MASVTIRRIDEDTKNWLRRRASATGRSVEGEIRDLLAREKQRDEGVRCPAGLAPHEGEGVGSWLYRISRPGFDIELPDRSAETMRDPFA